MHVLHFCISVAKKKTGSFGLKLFALIKEGTGPTSPIDGVYLQQG
jgi:hypothetical protein